MQINEEVLQRVIMMGFDKNFLIQSLHERIHNDVCKHSAGINLLLLKSYYNNALFLNRVPGHSFILLAARQLLSCKQLL